MKNKVDKFDVDEIVPADLSKLSDAIKMMLLKKICIMLRIKNIEHERLDMTSLATNTTLNVKINEVENKTSNITILATTTTPNAKINEAKGKKHKKLFSIYTG